MLTIEEVQRNVDNVESRSPADGARVVARAWANPEYKARLLADPEAALAEMGYELPGPDSQAGRGGEHRRRASPGGLYPLPPVTPALCWAARPTGTRASPTAHGP